ncbi:hypothetical protein [Azospirillum canadense]|uniref:hypothetical protein n=1 Tax=Azospirillum canadense TaxID=403962 RepID=UPI002227906D|nr:hypothetical protein [Azospirillum canadense]MCW2237910.1 hypothetical protein [Azospirillum canadense]
MQFRERRRVIQVIRTTYDPEVKRGRSEVLGKIDKAAPTVTDKLHKACTPEELAEIATYLANRQNLLRNEAVRAGAETLPAQMRAAAEYFRTHRDEEAKDFAVDIRAAWDELKSALRKAGFAKGKALKKAQKSAEKAAAAEAPAAEAAPVETPAANAVVEKTVTGKPAAAKKAAPVRKPTAAKKTPAARRAAVPKRTETAAVALMASNPEVAAEPVVTVPPVVADSKPDAAQ